MKSQNRGMRPRIWATNTKKNCIRRIKRLVTLRLPSPSPRWAQCLTKTVLRTYGFLEGVEGGGGQGGNLPFPALWVTSQEAYSDPPMWDVATRDENCDKEEGQRLQQSELGSWETEYLLTVMPKWTTQPAALPGRRARCWPHLAR